MATAYKVLGQSNPTASTETTLYTVPSATSAVVSTITVTNTEDKGQTYRIAVKKSADAGNATVTSQYIAYEAIIYGYDTVAITTGLTLATGDIITVYTTGSYVAFQAFGSQIS